jgi:hypothetical protein
MAAEIVDSVSLQPHRNKKKFWMKNYCVIEFSLVETEMMYI